MSRPDGDLDAAASASPDVPGTVAPNRVTVPAVASLLPVGGASKVTYVGGPWYEQRSAKGKKNGKWRVIWQVALPGHDDPVRRSEGGFTTQAHAKAWGERIHLARSSRDGWTFDQDGHPVQPAPAAPVRVTVMEDIQDFVHQVGAIVWKSDEHFDKSTSVLVRTIAHLVDDPALVQPLLAAWESQTHNQKDRPEPTTELEWAGRYLRDACLLRSPSDGPLRDPGLALGRVWLLQHSLPRQDVDAASLKRLHSHFHFESDGTPRAAGTARPYWGLVCRFCKWQTDRDAFAKNPTAGYAKVKRAIDEQRVDPQRVPDQPTIWRIALAVALRSRRAVEGMLVLVLAYAALRIGEACELRRKDVRFRPASEGGGAWISIRRQWAPPSDAEDPEDASKATKGHRTEAAGHRPVYLKAQVARILRIYMRLCVDDKPMAPLFPGKRAHRVEPDTFRREQWNPAIAAMFDRGDPLHDLDLHDLRRAGMTMWLRNQVPLNTIARWGGWRSRKVMLDVYAAVLPDDDELAICSIEDRRFTRHVVRGPELNRGDERALTQAVWDFRRMLLNQARK